MLFLLLNRANKCTCGQLFHTSQDMAILLCMEEILIEEKKYVSSKRAAQITGYAKDYVGQLCREGRVPARLVGRGWYVLESAIQDHRFGNPEPLEENVKESKDSIESPIDKTWEFPRYEATQPEVLPSINRLQEEKVVASAEEDQNMPEHLQESWRAWFDQVDEQKIAQTEETPIEESVQEKPVLQEKEESVEEIIEETPEITSEEVSIPIHAIKPRVTEEISVDVTKDNKKYTPRSATSVRNDVILRSVQIAGAAIALVMVCLAAIGSGYFDTYVVSNRQVQIAAGVFLYNK